MKFNVNTVLKIEKVKNTKLLPNPMELINLESQNKDTIIDLLQEEYTERNRILSFIIEKELVGDLDRYK